MGGREWDTREEKGRAKRKNTVENQIHAHHLLAVLSDDDVVCVDEESGSDYNDK